MTIVAQSRPPRMRPARRIRPLPASRPSTYNGEKAVSDWLRDQGLEVLCQQREYKLKRGVWVPDNYVPELKLNVEVTRADLFAQHSAARIRIPAQEKLAHKYHAAKETDQTYGTISVVVTWSDLQVLDLAPERFLLPVQELIASRQVAA
jgi:hypothetical protein